MSTKNIFNPNPDDPQTYKYWLNVYQHFIVDQDLQTEFDKCPNAIESVAEEEKDWDDVFWFNFKRQDFKDLAHSLLSSYMPTCKCHY